MIRVMILTGQSSQYHNWAVSSAMLAQQLDAARSTGSGAGLFDITVVTSPPSGADMSSFAPAFAQYDVVALDYEGDEWPSQTRKAFASYVDGGGGLVLLHAANNAFPTWTEFLEISGVGGWGGRDETWGPMVRWRDGQMVLDATTGGTAMHPPKHEFLVVSRAPDHPIMRGLPVEWMHPGDEIYSRLRGPANRLQVLATASASRQRGGTGVHEPMFMAIAYGKGRVFHNTLGHAGPADAPPVASLSCVGYIVSIQRGTEWAATSRVTQDVPPDFPTSKRVSLRGR
jgi:type 1 glutamine amidotransferase